MAKSGGSFVKGDNKKRRQKGDRNKKTLILETFCNNIIEGGIDRFNEELSKLKGKEYVNAYIDLLSFVKPKLKAIDVQGTLDTKVIYELQIVDGNNTDKNPQATQ